MHERSPGPARILVVDDERGPRESLRMILTPHHEVRLARSGSQALEMLGAERVDVVTLDLNMPGLGGQELMRSIHHEFPHVEIIVITGCGTLESAAEGIRYGICDYLQKPFDVVQVTAAVTRALSRRRARLGLVSFLEGLGALADRDRAVRHVLEHARHSRRLTRRLADLLGDRGRDTPLLAGEDRARTVEFLEVLAETIETKDRYMRGHARRVAFYAGVLADRLHLAAAEQERVRITAFLHDLGKVGVPTDLLLRAGALDAAEREVVEQHPVIGANLLKPLDLEDQVGLAIRHHHEWWDGSGYPDGVAGEEIPLTARIISVADAFDAMSCDRPYRRALSRDVVLGELRRFAGVQFDPSAAKEFVAILEADDDALNVSLLAESEPCGAEPATHDTQGW
jgi:putative nucleotidyltransferase with HDIG domain